MQYRFSRQKGSMIDLSMEHDAHVRTYVLHCIHRETNKKHINYLYHLCQLNEKQQSGIFKQACFAFE